MKSCNICLIEKPLTEFFSNQGRYSRSECKSCQVENNRRRREGKAPLPRKPRTRISKTPEYIRWKNIKRKYKISEQQWKAKLEEQNGVCAICRKPPQELDWRNDTFSPFVVDHNASTGQIRGLLCFKCNAGIGLLLESKTSLANAIGYLKYYDESG